MNDGDCSAYSRFVCDSVVKELVAVLVQSAYDKLLSNRQSICMAAVTMGEQAWQLSAVSKGSVGEGKQRACLYSDEQPVGDVGDPDEDKADTDEVFTRTAASVAFSLDTHGWMLQEGIWAWVRPSTTEATESEATMGA